MNNAHILKSTMGKKQRDSPAYRKCSAEIKSGLGASFKGSLWRSDVSETAEHVVVLLWLFDFEWLRLQ